MTAADLVRQFEGCRLRAYQDSAGVWTIGFGHTPAHSGQEISQGEAEGLLIADLRVAESALHVVKVPLTAAMRAALTSFVFNVGSGQFATSTLLRRLNDGRYLDVPEQLCRWKNAGGRPLLGLIRRRVAEAALFLEDGLPA